MRREGAPVEVNVPESVLPNSNRVVVGLLLFRLSLPRDLTRRSQVAEYPRCLFEMDWLTFLCPEQGLRGLDAELGLDAKAWQVGGEMLLGALASRPPSGLLDFWQLDACKEQLARDHPPTAPEAQVPYGVQAWPAFVAGTRAGGGFTPGGVAGAGGGGQAEAEARAEHLASWAASPAAVARAHRRAAGGNAREVRVMEGEKGPRGLGAKARAGQASAPDSTFALGKRPASERPDTPPPSCERKIRREPAPAAAAAAAADSTAAESGAAALEVVSEVGRSLPETKPWWLVDPESLVGLQINYLWNRDNQTFYEGTIQS